MAGAHEDDPTEAPETVDARMQRFEEAKRIFTIRLSEKEQARLASRCVRAQEKLSKISDRLDVRSPIITKKYDLINLHLLAVQKRLGIQQVDTSIIDLLITSFQQLADDYDTALADYHNALDDVTVVGCTSDPQTFKALLEDVRAKRLVFVDSLEAIGNFTKTELKTGFDDLRTRLNSKGSEQ